MVMVTDEAVRFDADGLSLQGVLSYREDAARGSGVLVVPPHPHFAGNLENNVVKALARVLAEAGHVVMRFNYRGVGESEIALPPGTGVYDYWDAVEREARHDDAVGDAVSAAGFLADVLGTAPVCLHVVGYSFGAVIGARVACRLQVASLWCLCMPWKRRYDLAFMHALQIPKCFLNGRDDFVFDARAFTTVFASLPEPKTHEIIGEDHFYRGEEVELAEHVRALMENAGNGSFAGRTG